MPQEKASSNKFRSISNSFTRFLARNWARSLISGLALLVVLLTVAVNAAVFFINSESGRNFIINSINAGLYGRFSAEAIHLSIAEGKITLKDIRLDGPGASPIARIRGIDADIEWSGLAKGQIYISEVRISGPEIMLFETIEGNLNLMAAFKPSAPSEPSEGGGLPLNIVINNAEINEGLVVYADSIIKTTVAGLKARAKYNLAANSGSIRLEIPSAVLDVPGFKTGFSPAVLEASLNKGNITSLNLDTVTQFGKLSLSGGISNLFTEPIFDLTLDTCVALEGIKKACGLSFPMSGMAAGAVKAYGSIGNPEGYARITCNSSSFGNTAVSGAEAESYIKNRQAVIRLKASDGTGSLETSAYTDLAAAFPFSFFTDKADIEKMAYGIDAKLRNLNLKNLADSGDAFRGGVLSGSISADLKGISTSKIVANTSIDITGRNLEWEKNDKGKRAESLNLNAKIKAKNGLIDFGRMNLEGAGSKIKTSGWYSLPSDSFSISTAIDLPDLEKLAAITGDITAKGSLKLDADLSGTLAKPIFTAKADANNLKIDKLNLGSIKMEASLDDSGNLKINDLNLKNGPANLLASGSAKISNDLNNIDPDTPVNLRASLKNFDPALFWTETLPFSGIFKAELEAKGNAANSSAVLKSEGEKISAYGVNVGNASLESEFSKGILKINDLSIANRSSLLSMGASIGLFTGKGFETRKDPTIDAEIKKADLNVEDFISDIEGKISASGSIKGTLGNPSGAFELKGNKFKFGKIKISSAALKAGIKDKTIDIESLDVNPVEKENLKLTGWIKENGELLLDLDTKAISLENFREGFSLPGLTGVMSASAQAKGSVSKPEFGGRVSFSGLGARGQSFKDFSLNLRLEDKTFKVESSPDSSMLNAWANLKDKNFGADLDLKNINLSPFFKAAGTEEFEGKTDILLSARGNMNKPDQITAKAGIRNLGIDYRKTSILSCSGLNAGFEKNILSISPSEFRIIKNGGLNVSGRWDIKSGLNFDVKSSLDLDDAAPLIQDILPDIEGIIKTEAQIRGSAEKPVIKGDISLNNIAFTLPDSFQKLHDLNGKITITPEKMTLGNIKGLLDDGAFTISGGMDLEGLKASAMGIRLSARNLPVIVPDTLEILSNINLSLKGSSDAPILSGEATIVEGTYYKDVDLSLISLPSRPTRKKPPAWESIENPFLKNMKLNIDLKKRDPLLVDNNLAKLELSPDLKLSGKLSAPVISGRCKVDSGIIYYRKNEYEVKKGVIDFINPYSIEPEFDIESSSKIKQWTVSLKISGTPEKLNFDLSSDPPLDDNEILSLVILGNVSKDVSGGQAAQRPASEMLGEMLASTFSKEIKSVAGLDILEAGDKTGQQEDTTRVTIGKNLSRRLAVKYAVDSKEGEVSQKAMAEYKLLENIILNGFRDSNGIYGGELQYRLEFR
ncbi:translocation/assembly module TamB domain-containing protein [Desulforegula conservatrix]|uniref:translocation/assembly module TamB domain-containing protein n=1 Tax=Desulforegula conservatrix TaxID=153026 RepID=UPI0004805AE9|nr:translocation/assembly module TamB domain-containing protein [Desulforegula conservatrix]